MQRSNWLQALVLDFLLWSESRQYDAAILQTCIPIFVHQFTLRWQNPPALVLGQLAWVFIVLVLCECGNSRTALMLFKEVAQTPIHLI